MTERNRNAGERPGPGTGAGSRQHEQQTAGGSMENDSGDRGQQPEHHGGTYHPEGDRGLEFEADQGDDLRFQDDHQQQGEASSDERRQEQQSERDRGGLHEER